MAVGVAEAVRRPVAVVAVGPAVAEPRRLDRGDPPLQRLGVPARSAIWPSPSAASVSFSALALVVAPAAQVHRLARARLDLHAQHVDEERQALGGLRRQQLDVADVGEVATRRAAQAVEVVGELAGLRAARA